MEYTVQELARMAGVSPRTLRYYDQIGLLKPARINAAGYRIYESGQLDRLQHILLYRELGVGLKQIKAILENPAFDGLSALKKHHRELLHRREQLNLLIANVEKTIAMKEGRITMADAERFEGFKRKLVAENEQQYGAEAREKYGHDAVEAANRKVLNMTPEQWAEVEQLSHAFNQTLKAAMAAGDPGGELAQKAADLHRQWLCYFWGEYNKEAHAGVTQLYVDDERFTAYYDRIQPGAALFLRDAVRIYTGADAGGDDRKAHE